MEDINKQPQKIGDVAKDTLKDMIERAIERGNKNKVEIGEDVLVEIGNKERAMGMEQKNIGISMIAIETVLQKHGRKTREPGEEG